MSSETDLIICKKLRDVAWPGNDWAVPSAYAHEAADLIDEMYEACEKALNFIQNTESELGIELSSGDALRAALSKARGGS